MAYNESHIGNEIYDAQYECPHCGNFGTDYDGYCVECGEQVVIYDEPDVVYASRNDRSDNVTLNLVLGLLSIALGLLGLVLGFIPIVLGIIVAIVAMLDGMPNNKMTNALTLIGMFVNILCLGYVLYQLMIALSVISRF